MKRQSYNWYFLFSVIALAAVFLLYGKYQITKNMIGLVETKRHILGAQEGGTIDKLSLEIGTAVKKGQVLVTLGNSDLEAEMSELQSELSQILNLEAARKNQYSLEFQRTRLRIENEVSSMTERMALLESKRTEFAGLSAEIDRLQKAEKAGLGHTRDLSDLIVQRDVIAAYLREQNSELELQNQKIDETRKMRKALARADQKEIVQSLLLEPLQRLTELRRLIAFTEHRMNMRLIISPADGHIVDITALPGDVVQEYLPIITVEESSPVFLTVYLPETSGIEPQIGQQVKITSTRSGKYNTRGGITYVFPGLSMIPERLSFRGQLFWARKIRVRIEENHQLLPGEIIHVRLLKKKTDNSTLTDNIYASEHAELSAAASQHEYDPRKIRIPAELVRKSRFEPSGITWYEDINRFLILSDDTGFSNDLDDHAAWLFLMDRVGQVEPDPVKLEGVDRVNDLEAVAVVDRNISYLISSQNISKKGKRPLLRQMLYKVERKGRQFSVIKKAALLPLIIDTCSSAEMAQLGLGITEADGKPKLNIEGCFYYQGDLFLGLKEPSSEGRALIWQLKDPDSIFRGTFTPDQLSIKGYLNLGLHLGISRGISDMTLDDKLNLWVLSTVPGMKNETQQGVLYKVTNFLSGISTIEKKLSFPGIKPEGVCFIAPDEMTIVFDNDQEAPLYLNVSPEAL